MDFSRNRSWGALFAFVVALAAMPTVASAGPADVPRTDRVAGLESRLVEVSRGALRARSGIRVLVEVSDAGGAEAAIVRRGGRVVSRSGGLIAAEVPAATLVALAGDPEVAFVGQPVSPHPEDVVGAGVGFHGADSWHAVGFDGTGIDILVVDSGFEGFDLLGLAGWAVGPGCAGGIGAGGNHGAAVAEIVADVAPGANLHLFRLCFASDGDELVDYVKANGIEIVNQSLAFFNTGPLDGSDPRGVLSYIDESVAAGVLWFNSAGNYRQRHWGGAWSDNGSATHEFGSTDYIEMHLREGDRLFLRWDDWTKTMGGSCSGCGSTVDLNLHLMDASGADVAGSWAHSTTIQAPGSPAPPTEAIEISSTGTYRIAIRYEPSAPIPAGLQIDLISQHRDLPAAHRVTARSLNDPSTFESVISIGAVGDVSSPTALSGGAKPSSSVQREYSSEGPTSDGRMKPDFAAADCVLAAPFTTFCGTSGASPHAAGLAALILQASGAPASELRDLLIGFAHDRGPVGPDNRFGHGVLGLGAAPSGTCGGVPATIVALSGQIKVHGTLGDDVIVGNSQPNRIWGQAGSDRICGGRGRDAIWPGSGDDWVRGQRGSDHVIYSSGSDTISGDQGSRDLLDFASVNDPVVLDAVSGEGFVGGDALTVMGFERFFGGPGSDVLFGSGRDEVLKGRAGDDQLRGRAGTDRLKGGPGADTLDAGSGQDDSINGGTGFDTCINSAKMKKCEA
jgi:subtilisin family serine protease